VAKKPSNEPSTQVQWTGTPRVAKLMALAIRLDQLIRADPAINQAQLAGLGHVSRARLTQIMNLLNLAPSIQEDILHLTTPAIGRDMITERHLRALVATCDWRMQKSAWFRLTQRNQIAG
jgi:hypothetical protein